MLLALFISTRLVGRICFCIFKFNVSAFWFFFLVNSESDAYPAVFTIFNSKRDPGLKPSFLFHIDSRLFLFFLLLALASCRGGIISSTFPRFEILVLHFWFTMNANPYQRDTSLPIQACVCIVFFSCVFILFLSLTLPTKCPNF